jgi:transketolase
MSCADIVAALYFYKMRHSAQKQDDPNRDRFIMSKGHSVLAQYAALAETGYFDKKILGTTKTLGSILQGHPERTTPGIEANTGSLGQGLSVGVGMALAGKADGLDYHVYVIVGDGELAEGQIWEAAMAASHYGLDNLTAIVDMNGIQAMGKTRDRYAIGNIPGRFAAFGWKTFEIDGHDMAEIVDTLDRAAAVRGLPTAIVARTVKGKGVDFAENTHAYHNNLLNVEEREKAIASVMASAMSAK